MAWRFSISYGGAGIWRAAVLLAISGFIARGADHVPRVLLLHSFGREFAPFNTLTEQFRTELAQELGGRVEFLDLALEPRPSENPALDRAFMQYLAALFVERPPDLIVPIGGVAARFVQRHREEALSTVPVLYACVDERHLQTGLLRTNDAVVAVRNEVDFVLEKMLEVVPKTTNVAVVVGASRLEQFWLQEIRRQFQPFTTRVSFDWLTDLPFREIQRRAASLPPRSAILYVVFSLDIDGIPYEEERALGALHAVARAPIFGLQGSQLGHGVVGGPLLAVEDLAQSTAHAAVRLLQGETPAKIRSVVRAPGRPVYDWRELQRWGIGTARLPADALVRFQQPTFWQAYQSRILAVAVLCALETILILLLVVSLLRRRQAERSLRESEERLSLATAAGDLGVWMWDVEADEIWATSNWRRLFGIPPDSTIRRQTVLERIHADDRPGVEQALKRVLDRSDDYVTEYRVSLPDGSIRWVSSRGRLLNGAKSSKHRRVLGATVDITERKRTEEAARDFGQKLIQAQEEERARVAKELHDGLSQNLALLAVELELFGQKPPGLPALVTQRMQDFSAQTKELSSEVHRLSHALHPAKLQQLGLAAAIGGFCREVEAAELLSIKFEAHNVPRMMPQDISLCVYRVAQEALQNVAKHSGARSAAVELSYEDGQVVMSIADDGRGFDTQAKTNGGSLGLVGMRERVHLVRGEITVESGPPRGTLVRVRVPLPRGDSG